MYVYYELISGTKAKVTSILYTLIPEQNEELMIEREDDAIPVPVAIPEMTPHLRIDLENNELYYDYISVETTESRLAFTQAELTQVRQALADTYEQLAIAQLESTTTQQALSDLYEQLLQLQGELATLKGG